MTPSLTLEPLGPRRLFVLDIEVLSIATPPPPHCSPSPPASPLLTSPPLRLPAPPHPPRGASALPATPPPCPTLTLASPPCPFPALLRPPRLLAPAPYPPASTKTDPSPLLSPHLLLPPAPHFPTSLWKWYAIPAGSPDDRLPFPPRTPYPPPTHNSPAATPRQELKMNMFHNTWCPQPATATAFRPHPAEFHRMRLRPLDCRPPCAQLPNARHPPQPARPLPASAHSDVVSLPFPTPHPSRRTCWLPSPSPPTAPTRLEEE